MMDLIYKQEFYEIKSACIEIRNVLGTGFLEKVYENALKIELEEKGFGIKQQYPIKVIYKNKIVGDYIADLCIDDKIIIEMKTMNEITSIHKAQLLNYLKATGIKLGILVNFSRDRTRMTRIRASRHESRITNCKICYPLHLGQSHCNMRRQ